MHTFISAHLYQRACQSMNTQILLDSSWPMRSKQNVLLPTDISLVKDSDNEKILFSHLLLTGKSTKLTKIYSAMTCLKFP